MTDQPRSYLCNGVRLTPIVVFGRTWLREDELAAAAGYPRVEDLRRRTLDAGIYRGGMSTTYLDTPAGRRLMRVYSPAGALQLALYLKATRSPEYQRRAHTLMRTLYEIQCGGFTTQDQEARA
ncbi:MAG: hypothetical protein ACPHN2_04680 [Sinimarinibacterium flocculans]|jgi:hypothetical protein|uniref:hypothetical protein n=1 Tax=Sinimarinibacterium flocculans TaxID=985250 RepID=UPI003C3D378B